MQSLEKITQKWRNNPEKPLRVIAFGSSNTELHWHSLGHFNWFSWLGCSMREWIGRHITVINQGINGETAEDLTKRIDRDVISLSSNLVIITIGGNDTWRNFTIEEYKKNLTYIIERVQEINAVPVLQTYYCLLYDRMHEIFQRFPQFVEVNRDLASTKEIPLIDQYRYFSPFYENDPENYSKLMLDGLHVNPIGNAIMGVIACRVFCLPDPKFPIKMDFECPIDRAKIKELLKMMNKFQELPPRRTKDGKKIKK